MASKGKAGLPQAPKAHTRQSGLNNWKSARSSGPHQPPIRCPECGSDRIWKDGLRYPRGNKGTPVQRYLCRDCGYRFSEPKVKLDVSSQPAEASDPRFNLLDRRVISANLPIQKLHDNAALSIGKDVGSHKVTTIGKALNTLGSYNSYRRVCALKREAKNLAKSEARQKQPMREGTKPDAETVKGLIVKYMAWLEKANYKSAKNRINMIKRLVDLGANLLDPESVKEVLRKQEKWTDGYKMLMTYAYESFAKMEGLSWQRPRYKQEEALPFIPTEEELDQLIAGAGKKLGTFLQGLKDTGADPGELAKLRWIDVNEKNRTVNIKPVKGHNPRILKVSSKFIRRLQTLPKESELIFNYASLRSSFRSARKSLSRKINNPRLLSISFTSFRHWKGTIEYHKTHDILHVKALLGHKQIKNTMVYVNLEAAIFTDRNNDEFHVAVAKNVEEACNLVKVGFEYVTGEYDDGGKIFRKRK